MRVPYAGRVYDQHELELLDEACKEFWLTSGRFTKRFEEGMAEFLRVKYCSFVNSGSSANLLAFAALTQPELEDNRIMPGDEVITTACCFPTTVAPIIQYGAIPIFIDIEIPSYNADMDQFYDAVSLQTKAAVLVHMMGNPLDETAIFAIVDLAERHLWVIEDNCDALGTSLGRRLTGYVGDISTCSFYPAHHITTGEGGMVCTDNEDLDEIIKSLRDWGRDCYCKPGFDNSCGRRFRDGYDHKYTYSRLGYNLKATDLQAAIGVAQLQKLPMFIQKRRENWQYLRTNLADLEEFFILPEPTPGSDPSWFGFVLTIRDGAPFTRQQMIEYLESKGIQTRLLFAGNITKQPCMKGVQYRTVGDLPNTNKVMRDTFWVGVYPGLTNEQLDYMVRTIRKGTHELR